MSSGRATHEEIRRSYDASASAYARRFRDELAHKPLDRALLGALADDHAASATSWFA